MPSFKQVISLIRAHAAPIRSPVDSLIPANKPVLLVLLDELMLCRPEWSSMNRSEEEVKLHQTNATELLRDLCVEYDSGSMFLVVSSIDALVPTRSGRTVEWLELSLLTTAQVSDLFVSVNELIACTKNRTLKISREEALEYLFAEARGYPRALEGIFTVLREQFADSNSDAILDYSTLVENAIMNCPKLLRMIYPLDVLAFGVLGIRVPQTTKIGPHSVSSLISDGFFVHSTSVTPEASDSVIPKLAGFQARIVLSQTNTACPKVLNLTGGYNPLRQIRANCFLLHLKTLISTVSIVPQVSTLQPNEVATITRSKLFGLSFERFHLLFECIKQLARYLAFPHMPQYIAQVVDERQIESSLFSHYHLSNTDEPNSWMYFINENSFCFPSSGNRSHVPAELCTPLLWSLDFAGLEENVSLKQLPSILKRASEGKASPYIHMENGTVFDGVILVGQKNTTDKVALFLELKFSYDYEVLKFGNGKDGLVRQKCEALNKLTSLKQQLSEEMHINKFCLIIPSWRVLCNELKLLLRTLDLWFSVLILSRRALEGFYCSLGPYVACFAKYL